MKYIIENVKELWKQTSGAPVRNWIAEKWFGSIEYHQWTLNWAK